MHRKGLATGFDMNLTFLLLSFFTAWCLRSEGVSSVLLGVSNTDQLIENLGALRVQFVYYFLRL